MFYNNISMNILSINSPEDSILSIIQWIYKYRFEILLCLCILFVIFYWLFKTSIDNYLKDCYDFTLPKWISNSSYHNHNIVGAKSQKIYRKYENECRRIFESIFNKQFPTVRPSFLKRKNGRNLELDGWCPELNLAFEYNGIQHYKFTPKFHKSITDFENQIQRDREKRYLCNINKIKLIEIPYNIKFEDLKPYIIKKLKDLGYL